MHKTLEELELALAPLIKLIPERKLQAKITVAYCYGKEAILYWDVLNILSYEVIESEYEPNRYFSIIEVQLTYGKVKVNFEDLLVKQPDPKILISNLVKSIELWAADEDGVHPDAWDAYVNAKQYLDPAWKPKDE